MKITGRNAALTYAGAESKLGIAWDSATPSEAKQITPSATNTTREPQSRGQSRPKTTLPAAVISPTWTAVLVTALPAIPARYADVGSGVPWIRLSTPDSRRYVTFIASAENVVDITAMP